MREALQHAPSVQKCSGSLAFPVCPSWSSTPRRVTYRVPSLRTGLSDFRSFRQHSHLDLSIEDVTSTCGPAPYSLAVEPTPKRVFRARRAPCRISSLGIAKISPQSTYTLRSTPRQPLGSRHPSPEGVGWLVPHLWLPFDMSVPTLTFVPPLPFLSASAAFSAHRAAGLLHPATDHGVRQVAGPS